MAYVINKVNLKNNLQIITSVIIKIKFKAYQLFLKSIKPLLYANQANKTLFKRNNQKSSMIKINIDYIQQPQREEIEIQLQMGIRTIKNH